MAIHINPTLLRNSANNLGTVVSTLNEVNNGMNQAKEEIGVCWQSDATSEYLAHFEDVQGKITDLLHEIQSIQTALRTAARKAEQAERDAEQIVKNGTTAAKTGFQAAADVIKNKNQK